MILYLHNFLATRLLPTQIHPPRKFHARTFQAAKFEAITNCMSALPPPHWQPWMPIEKYEQMVKQFLWASAFCLTTLSFITVLFAVVVLLSLLCVSSWMCAACWRALSVCTSDLLLPTSCAYDKQKEPKELTLSLLTCPGRSPSYGSLLVAMATPALDIAQNERRAAME